MKQVPLALLRRLWSFIRISPAGCWEWQGGTCRGYGNFKIGELTIKSHRLSYMLFIGPIPQHLSILHRCDNPLCCNPDHLFPGTALENSLDAAAKGRFSKDTFRKKGDENRGNKLTEAKIRWLWREYNKGRSVKQIADYLKVGSTTVYDVLKGRTWAHIQSGDDIERHRNTAEDV